MFNLSVKYKYRITNGKISVDVKKKKTSLAIQSFLISYVLENMLNY